MTNKRVLAIGGLAAALAASIGAAWFFASQDAAAPAPSAERAIVRLAWLHQAQFAGMYVAQDQGLYRDAGLDVELKEYEFEVDNLAELAEGKTDFAIASSKEIIAAQQKGLPVRAVATIYQIAPYAVATRTDSGITTPEDFKGRRLGVGGGSVEGHITYRALLGIFNIPEDQAEFVDLDFDMVAALTENRADTVDLYRTDQPYLIGKAGVPFILIRPEQHGLRFYGDVLVTRDDLIRERPDFVRAFVQATVEGWERALEDRDAAVDAAMRRAQGDYADRSYETFILSESAPLIKPTEGFRIGSMEYLAWQKSLEILRALGTLGTKKLDAAALYTTDFLPR